MEKRVHEPAALLEYLCANWPEVKRTRLKQWLKHQAVSVNGRPVTQFDHPLAAGDRVTVGDGTHSAPKTQLPGGLNILFEDSSVVVVEKPAGLLSMATAAETEKTAYALLSEHYQRAHHQGRQRVYIVHRLDRETSGLMVVARTLEAKRALQSQWDTFEKRYEAICEGRLAPDAGTWESDLDESNPYKVHTASRSGPTTRHAITHFRVLQRTALRTLVELTLATGRRHQIRVHLAQAGHPIIGDEKYGATTNPARRLGLHAVSLRFTHPVTGKEIHLSSPLPKELVRLLAHRSSKPKTPKPRSR
ncbi:MAG: RluA family pseudouridine synthase [Verrucomicrobiales bacterium]